MRKLDVFADPLSGNAPAAPAATDTRRLPQSVQHVVVEPHHRGAVLIRRAGKR